MRKILLASVLLAPVAALGQPMNTRLSPRVTIAGPTGLQSMLDGKMNYNGQVSTSCPIDACPTTSALAGPAYAFAEINAATTKTYNWEIGLDVNLLDDTGAGTENVGSSSSPGSKHGAYIGVMQTKNGGPAWSLNTNITRNAVPYQGSTLNGLPGSGSNGTPGAVASTISTIGIETDVNNQDQTSNAAGTPFIVGHFITGNSQFTSLAGTIYGSNAGSTSALWRYGIDFTGAPTGGGSSVQDAEILGQSNASVGYHMTGTHSTAGIYDETTGPHSLWITGTHTQQDVELNTSSPAQIQSDGSPAVGMQMNGNYTTAAIDTRKAFGSAQGSGAIIYASPGQRVCFNSTGACMYYSAGTLNRWYFTNGGGDVIMSLPDAAPARFKNGVDTAAEAP